MANVMELRKKRAQLWEGAKAFLDSHQDKDGKLSAEDAAAYDKMEADVVALGKDIERLERQAAIDAVRQLSVDVGIPVKNERIREEDLDQLAIDSLNDACYPGNPREATKEQVIEMFRKLM